MFKLTIVYCGFDPTFISKTHPKTGIVMAPLVIRALSHFVGSADPEELVLCPVRALLEYYERARQEGHVGTHKRLFVSARSGRCQIFLLPPLHYSQLLKHT